MVSRYLRLAVCAAMAIAVWNVAVRVGQAQRYGAPKPKPRIYHLPDDADDQSESDDDHLAPESGTPQSGSTNSLRVNPSNRAAQSTSQSRQQPRQLRGQPKVAGQAKQQPVRTATRNSASGQAKGAAEPAPLPMEKLEGENRAAFMKLIGATWIWSPAYTK